MLKDTLTHHVLTIDDVKQWKLIPPWIEELVPRDAVQPLLDQITFHHNKMPLSGGEWLVMARGPGTSPALRVLRFRPKTLACWTQG